MKKIIKNTKVLIAAFVLLFVALGGMAINAMQSSAKPGTPVHESNNETTQAVASTIAFYFKSDELWLGMGEKVDTNFLIVTNQAAIIDSRVEGTAVVVISTPFSINALEIGSARIFLSARMSDSKIKTINCTVNVTSGDTKKDDGKPDSKNALSGKLSYVFEDATLIEFDLVVNNKAETMFRLYAEVLEGDVAVGVIANTVYIMYFSENTCFKIRVTATFGSEIVAIEEVENRL